MTADLTHALCQRPMRVAVMQDGAPELWNLVRDGLGRLRGLGLLRRWEEGIDLYHLLERLGEAAVVAEQVVPPALQSHGLVVAAELDLMEHVKNRMGVAAGDIDEFAGKVLFAELTEDEATRRQGAPLLDAPLERSELQVAYAASLVTRFTPPFPRRCTP
jgi:hypothetical protein